MRRWKTQDLPSVLIVLAAAERARSPRSLTHSRCGSACDGDDGAGGAGRATSSEGGVRGLLCRMLHVVGLGQDLTIPFFCVCVSVLLGSVLTVGSIGTVARIGFLLSRYLGW